MTQKEKIKYYQEQNLTFEEVPKIIEEYSKNLKSNQRKCILCDDIVEPQKSWYKKCKCGFLGYDHDYDGNGKYSRYIIDYDRIKN